VQTVAVDWSFTGVGAIGEELAPLILGSLAFFEIEPDEVLALEGVVLAGYVDGLRDAGWHGDERLAHVGYLAAAALRYGLGSVGIVLPIALDESLHAFAEQVMRHSIDEMIDLDCQLFALTLSRAEQAQQLLDSL
jgi:hypothetical protein